MTYKAIDTETKKGKKLVKLIKHNALCSYLIGAGCCYKKNYG